MTPFPLDPVPYIRMYVLVVFILPWTVCGYYLVREYAHVWRHHTDRLFIFSRKTLLDAARSRSVDPVWIGLHRQSVRWQRITLFSWLVGAALLFCGLFWLESHDQLVNHRKGIGQRSGNGPSGPAPVVETSIGR